MIIITPTLTEIEAKLAGARRELSDAEQDERAASTLVDEKRAAFALEQIPRRVWLSASRDLASAQERTEIARARVGALSKLVEREHEAAAAVEREMRLDRDRMIADRGRALDGRIGSTLARLEDELVGLAADLRSQLAESRTWSPATDTNKQASLEAAIVASRAARRYFLAPTIPIATEV